MNNHREAFEAWAKKGGYDLKPDNLNHDYGSHNTLIAWWGWCAALAHYGVHPAPVAAQQRATVAAMALQGLLAWDAEVGYESVADQAVKHADALLAKLDEKA